MFFGIADKHEDIEHTTTTSIADRPRNFPNSRVTPTVSRKRKGQRFTVAINFRVTPA